MHVRRGLTVAVEPQVSRAILEDAELAVAKYREGCLFQVPEDGCVGEGPTLVL